MARSIRAKAETLRPLLGTLVHQSPLDAKVCEKASKLAGQLAQPLAKDENLSHWSTWAQGGAELVALEEDDVQLWAARGLRFCTELLGPVHEREFVPQSSSPLHQATSALPGIGPKLSAKLAERGFYTVEDLLWLVPRRYDDLRQVDELEELLAEPPIGERVVVRGPIHSVRYVRRGARGWIDLRMRSPKGSVVVRWFNAHAGMSKRYQEGGAIVLAGKLSERGGVCEMANPDVLATETAEGEVKVVAEGVVPVYPGVQGVPKSTLRKACQAACARAADFVGERIPLAVQESIELAPLGESLSALHDPPVSLSVEEVVALNEGRSSWHKRLAFEELFLLATSVALRRHLLKSDHARALNSDVSEELNSLVPFDLTGAQTRAIAEIADDLRSSDPMNRLLQGDVGAGKTIVAFSAALQAIRSGAQVALMVPTTILAEQHLRSFSPLCEAAGIRMRLLTASTPSAMRASTLSLLAAGEIDLLVGTHALVAPSVRFKNLGLVVVDEQHRFGVAQRASLREKASDAMPHLLVMTATPIPRSLALTAYGELDLSTLDEMPPGRKPTRTQVLRGAKGRQGAYRALQKRIVKGERAYVVCPMVERPEAELIGRRLANACDLASELREIYGESEVALVHGRISSDEREVNMRRFREGQSSILVATTVIEVGLDVPEAIIMMIEDADHFGLAQLHQLRGRVGRGGGASECVLLTSGQGTDEGQERLDIMVASHDGFVISEEDLRMRGPGELLGARQAGLPRLRFGDLQEHAQLLQRAKELADELVAKDPKLEMPAHAALRQAVGEMTSAAYGSEGG